ncbi:hypothetical protein ABIE58_002295 [Roseovarius sp. MBR-78]|uniref:hypothetical protein n=1 Tax=Roseovarius sp. MBR-78 TaxID=3156460 RepID=UPI00339702E9
MAEEIIEILGPDGCVAAATQLNKIGLLNHEKAKEHPEALIETVYQAYKELHTAQTKSEDN